MTAFKTRWVRQAAAAMVLGLCVPLLGSGVPAPRYTPQISTVRPSASPAVGVVTPVNQYAGKLGVMNLGMNLAAVNYYTTEWVFNDAMKASNTWQAQVSGQQSPWDTGAGVPVDAQGWPVLKTGEAAGTLILWNAGAAPPGRYTCLYDGKGKIVFGFDAHAASASEGRIDVDVVPNNGIYMRIDQSDPSDPIRNVRLYLPGTDASSGLFYPLFLERLKGFKVLRFMDWQQTNSSTTVSWSQRTTPDYRTQTGPAGVSVEYMCELCNEVGADPWFCMPAQADDDFVRQFATLVKAKLNKNRKIYIEYSNEVWNYAGDFQQTRYAQQMGLTQGLSTDPGQAMNYFYAKRAVEIYKIWEDVFGGHSRLVRVFSSQAANPWLSQLRLSYRDAYKSADVLAIAPYFGFSMALTPTTTVNDLITDAARTMDTQLMDWITAQKSVADSFGLKLIAYEGGAGFYSTNNAYTPLLIAANRDPRMYDLYNRYMSIWKQAGGGLFMAFDFAKTPSKYGCWGHLEYLDQPLETAPKFRALLDALNGKMRKVVVPPSEMRSMGVFD